jgi:uncharacterized protein (DUF1786 family)
MKILALDVGTGTQDIMLYDSEKNLENAVKLVLPSPTRILAHKIRKINQNIYFAGDTMGGGPVSRAIKDHLKKGFQVVMEENAARTIRDDLKEVSSLGINIIHNNPKEDSEQNFSVLKNKEYSSFKKIELKDVPIPSFKDALVQFEVDLEFDHLGVAVQDHGFSEKMGDRNFRFLKIREKLKRPMAPEEFAYWGDVPDYFTRMKAVARTLKDYKPLIMDSKFASICGATCDPSVMNFEDYIVVDVGNGHTTAASIHAGKIVGVLEHHTSSLTPEKIELFLNKLVEGTLTHEEIHQDHGHGAWVLDPLDKLEKVVVTGPRRAMMYQTNLPVYNATPAGDVMMTGPVGLIKSIKYNL